MKNILTLLLLTIATGALAQGTIRGRVTDGSTGDVLIGATVVIESTSKGAMADLDGNYSLEGVAPGTYTLKCNFISYTEIREESVEVKDGEVTIINFRLQPATIVIEQAAEVVTKADRSKDTYMESIKKNNPSMMDYISSQQIKKTGDSDAAGALKRVTGVSTVGNYVFVRGLSDRYLKTTLNGAEIPSLDPKRNSIQMDIFPTNLVDNLVVVKTLQADLPADYSGAYINVITKDFPETFTFKYAGSFGYNTNATFNDAFLTSDMSDTDWLGFDNGYRDVPSEVIDAEEIPTQSFSNYYEALVNAGYEQELADLGVNSASDIGTGGGQTSIFQIVNQIDDIESVDYVNDVLLRDIREIQNQDLSNMAKGFNNSWNPMEAAQFLDISQSLSFGDQGKLFGRPLGYVFGVRYKRANRFYDNGTTGRFTLTGDENTVNNLNTERLLSDAQGTQSTYISALLNLSYKISPNNKIGLSFMPNISGVNSARYQDGINPSDEIGLGQEQRSIRYLERNLNVYQARGEHFLPELGRAKVDWLASYTRGVQNTPDLRMFINSYSETEGGLFYFDAEGNDITDDVLSLLSDGENVEEYFPGFTSQVDPGGELEYEIQDNLYPSPTRFFREMIDNTLDLKFNVEIPFTNEAGAKNKIRFGGSYVDKTRDYTETRYSFISNGVQYNGNPDEYFAEQNLNVIPGAEEGYIFLRDDTDIQNSYDAGMQVLGGYGMLDWNLTSKLRVNTGVRVETTDMLLESRKLLEENLDDSLQVNFRGSLDLVDVLPSINLTYNLRQYDLATTNLRLSASQSVARPMFREKAPYSVFDFEVQEQQTGNPDLTRTRINNLDLRLEHFSRPGEVYSVSLFYKEFLDPIEQVIVATAANTEITWKNVDRATVLGAEFEVRKSLDFLGEGFAPFGIGANLTLVQSATSIDERELEVIRATDLDHEDTRPMYGQSPYVLNAIVSYDNDSLGLNVAVSYNVQGEKLILVTTGGTPDVYAQPTPNLDLTVSKTLGDRFSLRFSARNLLDPEYRFTYNFKGEEYLFQQMQWGRTFSLGFSYDI